MTDERVRYELRCSNCGRVIATIPEGEQLATDLVCPGCGATVKAGPLEKLAAKIKGAVDDLTSREKDKTKD